MKNFLISAYAISLIICSCTVSDPITERAEKVFEMAGIKYSEGLREPIETGWWCSGFYPGALWYIYEYTADDRFLNLAWKHTDNLKVLIDHETDHDIGFQINCSYGNALRLTGDSSAVTPTYLAAARKLAARMNPATGVTLSWNWLYSDWQYPVIIDNMMNLELLMKAAHMSGEASLSDIAVTHAETTLKNHFRPDWSCWHLVDYDPVTGAVISKETVQGYDHESAWARGQAWALYGYTMMYRESGKSDFLDAAENIGNMIIGHLPKDGIPYWDFDAPDIPKALRDASAGSIMASAFIELSTLTDEPALAEEFIKTARTQLMTLTSDEYLASYDEDPFFLLKHCVGNLPENSEVDVPLVYADYYLLEALLRYDRIITDKASK